MKKLNSIAYFIFITISSTSLQTSDCQKTEVDDYSATAAKMAKNGVIAFEDLDLVIAGWNTTKKLNIEILPKALIEPKIELFSFQVPETLQDAKKLILGCLSTVNKAKPLIAPKINGILMLHHPEDCPGYEETPNKYQLPYRDAYYAQGWAILDRQLNYLYSNK